MRKDAPLRVPVSVWTGTAGGEAAAADAVEEAEELDGAAGLAGAAAEPFCGEGDAELFWVAGVEEVEAGGAGDPDAADLEGAAEFCVGSGWREAGEAAAPWACAGALREQASSQASREGSSRRIGGGKSSPFSLCEDASEGM